MKVVVPYLNGGKRKKSMDGRKEGRKSKHFVDIKTQIEICDHSSAHLT